MSLVLAVSITPVSAADPQRVEWAGRDINTIESSTGPAIAQTDKGTIIINNIQDIDLEEHRAIAKQLGVTEQALENSLRSSTSSRSLLRNWIPSSVRSLSNTKLCSPTCVC